MEEIVCSVYVRETLFAVYVWERHTFHVCETHSFVWHAKYCSAWRDSLRSTIGLIDMCHMTHWYVWHDSLICVTRLIDCVTWLILISDVTHWYVSHDSLMCVMWPIHVCDMTHSYGRNTPRLDAPHTTSLMHTSDVTYSHVSRDIFMCVTWLIFMEGTRKDLIQPPPRRYTGKRATKEPLIVGLFGGNWPRKTRRLTRLRHCIKGNIWHSRLPDAAQSLREDS